MFHWLFQALLFQTILLPLLALNGSRLRSPVLNFVDVIDVH